MIAWFFTVLLWGIAAILLVIAMRRGDGSMMEASRRALREFIYLVPRLAVGVIGAGFLARLLPNELVAAHLGSDSGLSGLVIAELAGALTPGGPVVGFSVGTAALKAGAGLPQVLAYVTAWSLISLNRVIVWEVPIMPRRFVFMRVLVSVPLPILAGLTVMLLQR